MMIIVIPLEYIELRQPTLLETIHSNSALIENVRLGNR
jgi:hypothetical protein